MAAFSYVRAQSIEEAAALLADPQVTSCVIAGGTDLMVRVRAGQVHFERVVDVSQIAALQAIERAGPCLRLGAAATFGAVMRHPLVRAYAPCLAQACRSIGTMQVANMATLGGNTANAAAAADSVPALICLAAMALVVTPAGQQRRPVAELVRGHNRTVLTPDALIAAFEIPLLPEHTRTTFLKVGRRNALSIARMNIAALARRSADGTIAEVRLVPGACLRRPRRLHEVEDRLVGQQPSPALFAEAGQLAVAAMLEETGQRWSTEYKTVALAAIVEEALESVTRDE